MKAPCNKARMPPSLNGTSIISPTHCHPSPGRPFSKSSAMSQEPRNTTLLTTCKRAPSAGPYLPRPQRDPVSSTTPLLPSPPHASLRQSPVPGSWTAYEILVAARWIFRHQALTWTITPGAAGAQTDSHQLRHHQPLEHRCRQRSRPGCPTWSLARFCPPAPAPAAPTTLGSAWHTSPRSCRSPGPPLTGDTRLPHLPHPLRHPS